MEETSSSETRCKNPSCGRLLAQTGGHRQREYCGDACRQAARRHRKEQAHREEVARRWVMFSVETRSFLDWVSTRFGDGKNLAYAVELAIRRELDRSSAEASAQGEQQLAALRAKQVRRIEKMKARIHQLEQEVAECQQRLAEKPQPRATLSVEQAYERAGLHGYLDDGAYLENTQRLFVRVFQTGQVEPNEMREAIHHERGAEDNRLRQRVHQLEQALQERAAGQEAQQSSDDCREKLMRAGERVSKLERQVDIQRQHISQYHQRFYPSSLAVAAEKLLALGAALNYTPLPKYDELTVGIAGGAQAWQEFARTANSDDMAQAILQAQRFQQQLVECNGSQVGEEEEAAIHRLIVQDYAARISLSFPASAQCEIPFEHNGTTYSIVTGNLANHKVVAKRADGNTYETLEISDQEVTYFQDYCYRQLYQTYQSRLDGSDMARTCDKLVKSNRDPKEQS